MCLYPEASLGVLRREWVLGLWALLTGVSEGAGGLEPPSRVSPTLGQCREEDQRKVSMSVGQPTVCPALASQLPRLGPSAQLTGTVTRSPTSCLNRRGACLHCRRESPGPLGYFLLTSSWWVIVGWGSPSLGFPRRNLECPLHKVRQALRALVLRPEKGRGLSQRGSQKAQGGRASLPKSEFFSEAHTGGPGMKGAPKGSMPRVRCGCFWF